MDYNPSDEEHREVMQWLEEEGAAIFDGIDEDGEPIYKFDMNVLEEISPELYQAMMDDMDKVLVDLYQKGLIEISYDEDLNASMSVSPEGRIALLEAGFDMDEAEDYDSEEEEF